MTVALIFILSAILSPYLFVVAIYLFIITFAVTYFGQKYPWYFYFLFAINFAAILGGCFLPSVQHRFETVLFIITVTLFILLLQFVYFPGFMRGQKRFWTTKSLRYLDLINKEIFSCFLNRDYVSHLYLFERRLHVQKINYMRTMKRLRGVMRLSDTRASVEKIDGLFDILMDCAQLRRRVTDHTIFFLCADELAAIAQEIHKLLVDLILFHQGKKKELDTFPLTEKIQLFENIYHNVLRVTAREPLAFLLFITSLKVFREKVGMYD